MTESKSLTPVEQKKIVHPYAYWTRNFHPGVYLVPPDQIPVFEEDFSGQRTTSSFWMGVRGAQYFQPELRTMNGGSFFGELVLEPENEHDPFAVAVYAEKRKIGYLSATSSRHYYPRLGFLANSDQLLRVMVHINHPDLSFEDRQYLREMGEDIEIGAYVCVPSLEYFDQILPNAVLFDRLQHLWDALPTSTTERIVKDQFRLTEETWEEIVKFKHLASPYQFQKWFDPTQQDGVIEHFLAHTRRNLRAAEKQAQIERNENIVKWSADGMSHHDIAAKVGLRPSTISGIIRKGAGNEPRSKTKAAPPRKPDRRTVSSRTN